MNNASVFDTLRRVDESEPVSGGGDVDHAEVAGGELVVAK